jgi:hypothetical protein
MVRVRGGVCVEQAGCASTACFRLCAPRGVSRHAAECSFHAFVIGSRCVCVCVFVCVLAEESCVEIAAAGAIHPLIEMLQSPMDDVRAASANALNALAEANGARQCY